jgi:hypothetical protein
MAAIFFVALCQRFSCFFVLFFFEVGSSVSLLGASSIAVDYLVDEVFCESRFVISRLFFLWKISFFTGSDQ